MSRLHKTALALIALIAWLSLMMLTEPGATECDDANLNCAERHGP